MSVSCCCCCCSRRCCCHRQNHLSRQLPNGLDWNFHWRFHMYMPDMAFAQENVIRFGDIRVGRFGSADSDQSVDDFNDFFCHMDTKCDVDDKQTFRTLYDFRIHRIGGRVGRFGPNVGDFQNFFRQMHSDPNAMLTINKQFWTFSISASTESAIGSLMSTYVSQCFTYVIHRMTSRHWWSHFNLNRHRRSIRIQCQTRNCFRIYCWFET